MEYVLLRAVNNITIIIDKDDQNYWSCFISCVKFVTLPTQIIMFVPFIHKNACII